MKKKTNPNLEKIKLLVLDVDGVLTDGSLHIHADGSESKTFNTLDGHGIRLCQRAGVKVALLSGRYSAPTQIRADQLEIEFCIQDAHYKLPELKKLADKLELKPENIAYIGDDLPDLPVIAYVGFGVAVAGAVDEVKQYADMVTTRPGGKAAVREVIEHILKATDKWAELMERYIP